MRKKVIAISLVLFLGFLTGSSTDAPLVLCFGDNGHIGIEAAHGKNGHTSVPRPMHVISSQESPCHDFDSHKQNETCGNCYDFLLISNSYTVNPKKERINTQGFSLPVVPDLKYLLPFKLNSNRARLNPVTQLHIKTTVLLI